VFDVGIILMNSPVLGRWHKRQLSGYARDEKIRTRLKIDNEIAKCLIIYPNKDKTSNDLSNLWNDGEEIQGFVDFKKNRCQTTSLPHLKIKITAQSREGFVTLPNSKFKDGL
jgi:hypothetical protein